MKRSYVKEFMLRGLTFSGLGPIVLGIVYAILQRTLPEFSLTGGQVCLAIVSTYLLAFVQAGASVFNQIEHWSLPKALAAHFSSLYAAYVLCYVVNTWIPFKAEILLIFTGIFVAAYLVIWLTVFFTVKAVSKRLNANLL